MIVVFDLAAEQAPASEFKSPEVFLGDNDTLYVTVPGSQQTQWKLFPQSQALSRLVRVFPSCCI